MAMQREWRRVYALTPAEKADIAAACERLVAEKLKPRHLPAVRPSKFNYPVDIYGKWRGSKYSFIVRYRSGYPDNEGEEFDAPFARLDHLEYHIAEIRFDVMWHRHTGKWWRLHSEQTLADALRLIETDGVLSPPI